MDGRNHQEQGEGVQDAAGILGRSHGHSAAGYAPNSITGDPLLRHVHSTTVDGGTVDRASQVGSLPAHGANVAAHTDSHSPAIETQGSHSCTSHICTRRNDQKGGKRN